MAISALLQCFRAYALDVFCRSAGSQIFRHLMIGDGETIWRAAPVCPQPMKDKRQIGEYVRWPDENLDADDVESMRGTTKDGLLLICQ